jgi:hypothetical protein
MNMVNARGLRIPRLPVMMSLAANACHLPRQSVAPLPQAFSLNL